MQALSFPPPYFMRPPGQFVDRAGTVTAAPLSTGNVAVSFRVPDRMACLILAIGFDGGQLTNVIWATWELRTSGVPDPEFVGVQGMIARVLEPTPFYRWVVPGTLVELVVANTNAINAFQYTGRIQAFFQDDTYLYGAPAVGVDPRA